jgi:hypothetical protein
MTITLVPPSSLGTPSLGAQKGFSVAPVAVALAPGQVLALYSTKTTSSVPAQAPLSRQTPGAGQSVSVPQARQEPLESQTGAVALRAAHSVPSLQPRQLPFVPQKAVAPVQAAADALETVVHCTHLPGDTLVSQTIVPGMFRQSLSLLQPMGASETSDTSDASRASNASVPPVPPPSLNTLESGER